MFMEERNSRVGTGGEHCLRHIVGNCERRISLMPYHKDGALPISPDLSEDLILADNSPDLETHLDELV